jgi:septal ring factor EnvC (AmiA/AmiB activator)
VVTHMMGDAGLMACCGRTPFEVSSGDRLTKDPTASTCPGTRPTDPAALPTSLLLQQAQQALAASQQDLTRVEQERDQLSEKWHKALADGDELTVRVMTLRRERDEARHDLAHAEFEIGKLRAQLDHLRALLPNPTSTEEDR